MQPSVSSSVTEHRSGDGWRLRRLSKQPLNWVVSPGAGIAPKATVVSVHGVCEHTLRGGPLALQLARHGYWTLLFDLLGHGALQQRASDFRWLVDAYTAGTPEATLVTIRKHPTDARLGRTLSAESTQ